MNLTIKENQLDELGERSRLRAQCDEKHGWPKQFWQHWHGDTSLNLNEEIWVLSETEHVSEVFQLLIWQNLKFIN